MRVLARCFATFVVALTVLVTIFGRGAQAEGKTTLAVARPGKGPRLSIDGPKSNLHLEVDGMCQPRSDDAGANGATCPVLDYEPGKYEALKMIMGDGYGVDIVTEDERVGTGEERAQRAVADLCTSIPPDEPRLVVTFGDRRFVRARSPDGSAICFVTADDRPDVAAIIFRALDQNSMLHIIHPEFALDLAQEADVVMGTLRASTPSALPTKPAARPATARAANSSPVIVLVIIAAAGFGLLLVAKRSVVARLLGLKRGSKQRVEGSRVSQLAGSKCVVCKRNIHAERTAVHCLECELPVHKDCLGRHANVAHGPPPGAYR